MTPLLLRTLLFVPANRERMVARAQTVGADAIVLDLEDAVPAREKAAARSAAAGAITALNASGPVFVRVNAPRTGLTRDDLLTVVREGLSGVILPKPETPQDVRDLDVLLREAESAAGVRPGDVRVIPLIESPRGLLRAAEIIDATDRTIAVSIGAEDYCAELGVERNVEGTAIAHLRYTVVTLAAARRLPAIDTPYGDIADSDGLVAETRFARAIGFVGKYVLHPDQVHPVNTVFTPAAEDVERARRTIEAYDEAQSRGEGSAQLDGRMVDAPVVARARRLLEHAQLIEEREAARSSAAS